ncbi:hypothetical protein EJ06DRAFT_559562 [Trichodelitschia bisporula]|uniref:Uncharacterized protein n=1 Tax=Trichodelitschia bisporula TaxID=703511 RepID=A0A6G1HM13_9PEZI|nr:hypothetical protein EJ06DRAFT_559562 [Trichodelitschia bisporula]
MAFTGPDARLAACIYCRSPRYYPGTQKPRNRYLFIPITPRLRFQYRLAERARVLKGYRQSLADTYEEGDLFKGFHRKLGILQGPRDIALQLSLDGMQVTQLMNHKVTPIILFNLNLLPRYRWKHISPTIFQ